MGVLSNSKKRTKRVTLAPRNAFNASIHMYTAHSYPLKEKKRRSILHLVMLSMPLYIYVHTPLYSFKNGGKKESYAVPRNVFNTSIHIAYTHYAFHVFIYMTYVHPHSHPLREKRDSYIGAS